MRVGRLLVVTAGCLALGVTATMLGTGSSAEERSSRESVACGPGGRIAQENADVAREVVKAMPPNTPEAALQEAFSYMDPCRWPRYQHRVAGWPCVTGRSSCGCPHRRTGS